MAVSKLWPVTVRLATVLDYASNPEKTTKSKSKYSDADYQALRDVVAYAKDGEKTERELFCEGIHCNPQTAREQFITVKEQFGKPDGIQAYAFNNAGESLKKYILLKKGELAYNHGASKLRPYGSCFALTTAENARIPFDMSNSLVAVHLELITEWSEKNLPLTPDNVTFGSNRFTTRMCEAGVNINVIQDALGYTDISTTLNICTDVTKELKTLELKGLDNYFKAQ